jgi:hypothetical protein
MSDGTVDRIKRGHGTLLALLPMLVLCFLGILLNVRMRQARETRRPESQVIEKAHPPAAPSQIITAGAALRE